MIRNSLWYFKFEEINSLEQLKYIKLLVWLRSYYVIINRPISHWPHNTPSLHVKHVSFQNVNNLLNTEFPLRIITITTTSAISSGLRPQTSPDLARYRLYVYISIKRNHIVDTSFCCTTVWRSERQKTYFLAFIIFSKSVFLTMLQQCSDVNPSSQRILPTMRRSRDDSTQMVYVNRKKGPYCW